MAERFTEGEVENAARALSEYDLGDVLAEVMWDEEDERDRLDYTAKARAALEASGAVPRAEHEAGKKAMWEATWEARKAAEARCEALEARCESLLSLLDRVAQTVDDETAAVIRHTLDRLSPVAGASPTKEER